METTERPRRQSRNANVVTTVWMSDGTQHTVRHRNSMMGFVNEMRRRGWDSRDVVDSMVGMPDSDRV